MKIRSALTLTVLSFTLSFLPGCGGGGDSSSEASTLSFPLRETYVRLLKAGGSTNFRVSGSCSGTAVSTDAQPVESTFEGVSGFSVASSVTMNLSNCVPATSSVAGFSYYDADYMPLGADFPGAEYGRIDSPPPSVPASVKVGDAATVGTMTLYTDRSKTGITGKRVLGYAIEKDTPETAIANLISRDYDLGNRLISTEQSRYRIRQDGSATLLSIDLQYSTTSSMRLVFTPM